MRVAVLSDIHGNLVALNAVLSDLEMDSVDQILCLGDVVVLGPQPQEVIARLGALPPSIPFSLVMGNTDAWALKPKPHPYRDEDTPYVNSIELWSARQLSSDDLAYLATFQPSIEVCAPGGRTLLGMHGSPRSLGEPILATTPDDVLAAMLEGHRATIVAAGHTHVPMLRRFRDMVILNPGSVGYPVERAAQSGDVRHPPWAEYAVVTLDVDALKIDFRRVPIDVDTLVQAARVSGMPHVDWWIAPWR